MKAAAFNAQGRRLLMIALAAGICSCSSTNRVPSTGGTMPNKNWWNFYERGLTRLGAGDFENARIDFEIALGKRKGARYGNNRDRWRELTYGLHVIESYFPNREIGISLHKLGEQALAEHHLELSLTQTPSARAKHYLNEVRAAGLKSRTVPAPTIELAGAKPGWTSSLRLRVTGTAKADALIREMQIGDAAPLIELALPKFRFDENVPLQAGTNRLQITAIDLKGQRSTIEQTWIVDRQKPQLVFRKVTRQGQDFNVEAILIDDFALKTVRVNGASLLAQNASPATKRSEFPFTVRDGGAGVTIEAEDFAGNQFHTIIGTTELRACAPGTGAILLASADTDSIPAVARDQTGAEAAETLRPGIRLEGVGRELVVYEENFFIDGWVEDASGIQKISLSGENMLGEESGARRFYFSRLVSLAEGENRYELQAVDAHGNETRKAFVVTYKIPARASSQYRLSLGVPPVLASRDNDMGRRARAALKASIAHDQPRFRLLTRDEALKSVLLEQKISLSNLAEERAKLNIQFDAADLLLITQFIYEPGGITFFGSAVDTETGEIICYEDVYTEIPESYPELKRKALGLVLQIEQQFPLVDGKVTQIDGSKAVLNIGTREGIRSGMRFVVSRSDVAGGTADGILRLENRWVELKATNPEYETCRAEIFPRDGKRALRPGDNVFAR